MNQCVLYMLFLPKTMDQRQGNDLTSLGLAMCQIQVYMSLAICQTQHP